MSAQIMNDAQLALIAEAMKKPLEDVKKEYEEFLEEFPNGLMDKSSFFEWMSDTLTAEMSELIFKLYDEDKSGYLDFREFSQILIINLSDDSESTIDIIFRLADIDGDNLVDINELSSILRIFCEMKSYESDLYSNLAMLEYDKDGDGKLSKQEFLDLFRKIND